MHTSSRSFIEMLYWDQKRHTHIWIPYKSFTFDYCGFSSTCYLFSSSINFPVLQLRLQDTLFLTRALFRSLGAHFILVPVDLSPVPLLLASPWPFPGCRVCFVLSFRLAVMSHIRDGWFICRLSGHTHARPITSAFFFFFFFNSKSQQSNGTKHHTELCFCNCSVSFKLYTENIGWNPVICVSPL